MSRRWQRFLWRAVRVLLAVALLAGTGVLVAMVHWPPVTHVWTGQSAEYPELNDLVLRYSPRLVFERTIETVEDLSGWSVVAVHRELRIVEARVELPIIHWTYTVAIGIEPHGTGSLLRVLSRSDGGRGDFGQNARNIRLLQARLQANLRLARQSL